MGINILVHAHEDEHACAGVPRSGGYSRPPARFPGPARRTNRRRLMLADGKVRACESLYACVHARACACEGVCVCVRVCVCVCVCERERESVLVCV